MDIQISHKTIQLGQTNTAAIINAVESEIDSSYQSAKWNVGRALFGDGTGKLATINGTTSSGQAVLKVDSVDYLIEGLVVDCYDYNSGTPTKLETHRIKAVNRVPSSGSYSVTLDGNLTNSMTANEDFITVQGSYNREITGLAAIFNSGITTLYGMTKSANPEIIPISISAAHDITDIVLYDAVKQARRYKNSKIDLIMMGDAAFTEYQKYMIESNVSVVRDRKFEGGTAGLTVLVGDQMVDIVNEHFVPSSKAWGVDTTAFTYYSTPWDFATYNGSSAFELINGTSIYRALLASYGEMMCKNPGGCIEITDCDPT